MPMPRVTEILLAPPESELAPESGEAEITVRFEDGGSSVFAAATPDRAAQWIEKGKKGWHFGNPVLFVIRLDRPSVEAAVAAMASDMGGYWLRYYNSPKKKPAKPSAKGPKVASAQVTEAYPPRKPDHGCAASQVIITDGREFSLLTTTPSWFQKTFAEMALAFYYGPSFLFVRRLDQALIRKSVKAMAEEGDRLLCLYDTPRRTLPEVLAQFKSRHTGAPSAG
ncbi:MAG: hypothetical protein HY077_07015 [Elusimicrobia bacterium]|nr:hypothetical protein [Elusimicrobiota bacterium]